VDLARVATIARRDFVRLGLVARGVVRDGRDHFVVYGGVEIDASVEIVNEAVSEQGHALLALVDGIGPVAVDAFPTRELPNMVTVTVGREAWARWQEITGKPWCVTLV
jgi:hypothetical protein